MILQKATFDILGQLSDLLEQFEPEEYTKPLDVISGNTVGKHVRHIVEFYVCLVQGMKKGIVNYDDRKRDLGLETKLDYVQSTIQHILSDVFKQPMDVPMEIQMQLQPNENPICIQTTFFRELAYNLEHTIHHFALIRIALESEFKDIMLPASFGIAYSTLQYQAKVCAQ